MKQREIHRGLPVVVNNLLRLADANKKSLMDCQPCDTPPMVFKQDYVDKRRLRACGIVADPPAGQQGSGVFVVEHEDGTRAVYHCSELASVQVVTEATLGKGKFQPQRRARFRGTWVEVYVGIEPAKFKADMLIVSLPAGTTPETTQGLPLHADLKIALGEDYHQHLFDPSLIRPLQTFVGHASGGKQRPVFGDVLFIYEPRPCWDAIDAALRAAHEEGSRNVVLPIREFLVMDHGADDFELDELLEMIDVVIDGRNIKFASIKIVV